MSARKNKIKDLQTIVKLMQEKMDGQATYIRRLELQQKRDLEKQAIELAAKKVRLAFMAKNVRDVFLEDFTWQELLGDQTTKMASLQRMVKELEQQSE